LTPYPRLLRRLGTGYAATATADTCCAGFVIRGQAQDCHTVMAGSSGLLGLSHAWFDTPLETSPSVPWIVIVSGQSISLYGEETEHDETGALID